MLSSELYHVYKRMGGRLLSWFYWFLKFWFFSVRGSSRVGFHTSFGDGSDIPEGHLEHVRDVVWKNMVFNHWKQGDIVMIDNFRISHGRQVTTDIPIFSLQTLHFPPIRALLEEAALYTVLHYDLSLSLYSHSQVRERSWCHGPSPVSIPFQLELTNSCTVLIFVAKNINI